MMMYEGGQYIKMFDCSNILNVAMFKYSLHNFTETQPKIPNNLSIMFNYCTQLPQNWQDMLIMNIDRSIGTERVCYVP